MSEKGDTANVKESSAHGFMARWLLLLVVLGVPVGIVNLIYGSLCEGKCEELCQKDGFPISTWYSDSGFWFRPIAALNGRHGTCLCDRQRIGSALSPYNGPGREIRLTFGK
jgi:hypothetical protein